MPASCLQKVGCCCLVVCGEPQKSPSRDFIFIANKWYNFLRSLDFFLFDGIFLIYLLFFLCSLSLALKTLANRKKHLAKEICCATLWLIQEFFLAITSYSFSYFFFFTDFSLQKVLEKLYSLYPKLFGRTKGEEGRFPRVFLSVTISSSEHRRIKSWCREGNRWVRSEKFYKILTKGRKKSRWSPFAIASDVEKLNFSI